MFEHYSGKTRIFTVIGDPIAQVKSPEGMTRGFAQRGVDAIVVPLHVPPDAFAEVVGALTKARNVDGILATVPHKFSGFQACATATDRARFLGAANLLRRNALGQWHGDMVDGLSFYAGIAAKGCAVRDKRILVAGAGGAGCAIAYELMEQGAAVLAVHDSDHPKRDALVARLNQRHPGRAISGTDDPTGFDIIVNASPAGMNAGDVPPVALSLLRPEMFVGEVITLPEMTPLMIAAEKAGCAFATGLDMSRASFSIQMDYLLGMRD